MSLLFIDGFNHYAQADVSYKWASGGNITSTNPRRAGGQCMALANSAVPGKALRMLGSTVNTVVVGLAVRMTNFGADHQGFRLLVAGNEQATLTINTDQSISVKRGSYDGTVLGTSATGLVPTDRYVYLEFKIYVHDSAGTYEVRLNDAVVLSGSSVDTKAETASGVDAVYLRGQTILGGVMYVDDMYIDDADFHGDSRVDTIMPNAVGMTTDWTPTPSGTDNYANVDDDAAIDEGSTYNSSDVATDVDSFAFANLEPLGTDVYGVAINITARKDDAGTRKLRPVCIIDSTEYTGDEVGPYDNYGNIQYVWDIPPDISSGAWTEAEVNAAEFGYKLTV